MELFGTILSVLFMLVLFIAILFLAYAVTSAVGKRYNGRGGGSRYIQILDRAYLGQDKSIVLAQTGGKTLLLGVTQHHVETLCEIDPQTLPEPPASGPENAKFSELFKTVLKENWGIGAGAPGTKKGKSNDGEI